MLADEKLKQIWCDYAAGLLTDAQAQAAAEAVEAGRAPPKEMTPAASSLPASGLPRRSNTRTHEKVFGSGRPVPLDRNAKARIVHLARALMRRTEQGKHYGQITAKAFAVLQALLWGFHNAKSGRCFPSYEKVAEAAGCARSTVYEAIKALEDAGLLTWVNRLCRVRQWAPGGLPGVGATRSRVLRTSNGYRFSDPGNSSKSDFPSGTTFQGISSLSCWPLRPSPRPKEAFERGSARLMPA